MMRCFLQLDAAEGPDSQEAVSQPFDFYFVSVYAASGFLQYAVADFYRSRISFVEVKRHDYEIGQPNDVVRYKLAFIEEEYNS